VVVGLAAGLLVAPGCDSASFLPPPPPELSNPSEVGSNPFAGTMPTPPKAASPANAGRKDAVRRSVGNAKIVELILSRSPNGDRVYLVQALRRDFGKVQIVFRTVEPKAHEPDPKPGQVPSFTPSQLAEAIRAAVERGVAGLIVEPLEDPAVLDALYDADARGLAVLLLDRPVPARGGKSLHSVGYTSFVEPGRQIVQATLDAAKLLRQLEGGRIIVLHGRSADAYDADRLGALAKPLKAAGKSSDVIEFEGDSDLAAVALKTALDANPKVAIVLADDSNGMFAAYQVSSNRKNTDAPEFLFAGFLAYDYRSPHDLLERAIAFSDRSVEAFATKTFQAIYGLLNGKPVDERVEVPITVHKKSTLYVPKTR
jgi:ABC-type sugar transport system substrate-binding protein